MTQFYRVVGTGSREWEDVQALYRVLDALIMDVGKVYLAQGGARGADQFMIQWCGSARVKFGPTRIAMKTYPAKWKTKFGFDRSAGFNRNRLMVDEVKPNLVLAFIRDNSGGATQCAQYAIDNGYETIIFRDGVEPQHVKAGDVVVLPTGH